MTGLIHTASYGEAQVYWIGVEPTELAGKGWLSHRGILLPDGSTEYGYHARLLIRFCEAQSAFSIRGPLIHCLQREYRFCCEGADKDTDVNGRDYSIDAELVEQAIAKRLSDQNPGPSVPKYEISNTYCNYLSETFVRTVFTSAIPNTPLVNAAMGLSKWHWSAGLVIGIPLLAVELLLRTIANVGLSLAIAIQHWFDPAEAELLKLRSLMNSKDPTRAMMACLNACY